MFQIFRIIPQINTILKNAFYRSPDVMGTLEKDLIYWMGPAGAKNTWQSVSLIFNLSKRRVDAPQFLKRRSEQF
jgi:hypothetical protein